MSVTRQNLDDSKRLLHFIEILHNQINLETGDHVPLSPQQESTRRRMQTHGVVKRLLSKLEAVDTVEAERFKEKYNAFVEYLNDLTMEVAVEIDEIENG